jgi:DNA-binding transcriptional LysR family regulator
MELRRLHTFVAVAELLHFARAADRCNLSQPAVSHQVRLLEEELGTPLLNRAGRTVSLTLAGEVFLEEARRILASVDRARERVQGISSGAHGRVRIGGTETIGLYLLPALLDRYRQSHSNFALQFSIDSELHLLEQVAANDLDMAVVAGRPVLGELTARRIGRDELVVITSGQSRLAKARAVKPADLRGEQWIVREEGADTRRHQDAWLRRQRLTPARTMTLRGADAVKRAVIAGLGIGVVSRTVVGDELSAGRIAIVPVNPALPARDVLVVDHPQKHHGAACKAMLGMLETI